MRVPLIWRPAPNAEVTPARVAQPVGHLDLAPTFCAIAGIAADPRMQGAPLPTAEDGSRQRVLTEWDGNFEGREVRQRSIYRDGYLCTVCEPTNTHDGTEGELYDLKEDPRQFVNRWSDPAYAALKRDLIADLYDNLPAARAEPLEQVALV